jgi:hypothetical protein
MRIASYSSRCARRQNLHWCCDKIRFERSNKAAMHQPWWNPQIYLNFALASTDSADVLSHSTDDHIGHRDWLPERLVERWADESRKNRRQHNQRVKPEAKAKEGSLVSARRCKSRRKSEVVELANPEGARTGGERILIDGSAGDARFERN